MVRFTRTGLEGLTNQAIHEIAEDRKKSPQRRDESLETEKHEQETATENPKEEKAGTLTYGTNETTRMMFAGSYHTFTTNSSNQLQCTCCPEPILIKAVDINEDFSVGKKDSTFSGSQTYTGLFKTEKKSDILYK